MVDALPSMTGLGYYRVLGRDTLGGSATQYRALISFDKNGREIKDSWAFNGVDVHEVDRESVRIVKRVGFKLYVKYDRIIWSLREAARDLHSYCPYLIENQKIREQPHTPLFWEWEVGYFPPKSLWKILMTED